VLSAALLVTALVYYNFIDKVPTSDFTDDLPADEGNEIGNICYDYTFRLVGSDGELTLSDLRGKAVVINFWGTWCGPCCAELPHFNELASEYSEDCEFVIIHSFYGESEAEGYINANFPDSEMNFVYDDRYSEESTKSKYYSMLAGVNATTYPVTFVLDAEGKITFSKIGGITYDALKAEIEKAMAAE
jgi:thiol-disulfide isomerase/thioredoxin